jgi:hypothetical protein
LIRGEPAVGRVSRAATLYSVGSMSDPDHEAAIRFSGEAPRWRAHSGLGFEAMAVFESPPPRIMISDLCANARKMPKLGVLSLLFDQMVQATAGRSATPTGISPIVAIALAGHADLLTMRPAGGKSKRTSQSQRVSNNICRRIGKQGYPRDRPLLPKSGFSRLPPVHRTDLEGRLWVQKLWGRRQRSGTVGYNFYVG